MERVQTQQSVWQQDVGAGQRSWLLRGVLWEPLHALREAALKNPVAQTRAPSSSAAWAPRRARRLPSRLECFHFPRTRSLSEITVSNYWLRSAVVVLMSPSFSTSLKAHRFLHTLNPAACRVHLGPPCRVLGCQHRKLSTAGVTAEFFYFFFLTATLLCCVRGGFLSVAAPPLCLPACMCVGFHSCATVMVYWAGGAPEAIRARGMRLCTRWSHKGPLWRPCQRVEQTSYLPAKRYPRRSIPQSSTMPTHQEGQGVCTRKDRAPRGWGGWLRGTGWAAINFVSYICMRPARHTKPPS